jgi:RHS repeat-associated protein
VPILYNYFRDYDPAIGGYTQADPMGPVPGIGVRPELLATTDDYVWAQVGDVLARGLNRSYAYVDNNPLSSVDPRGLWSFKFSYYWRGGGSITFGRDHGQFFGRLGLGVGMGGGFKFYPEGSFPESPTQECGCGARAFIGSSASISASLGPASAEYKGQAGGVITQDCNGKPKMEYIEDTKFDWSLRGRTGWGLSLGGGINIVDMGVAK